MLFGSVFGTKATGFLAYLLDLARLGAITEAEKLSQTNPVPMSAKDRRERDMAQSCGLMT